MTQMVNVQNVSTRFKENIVHEKINLCVNKGEIFGILGGSGSGKTTLLRQMILLEKINSGDIEVLGHSLQKISEKKKMFLRLQWGVLFQFGALFSSLNVLENIAISLKEFSSLDKKSIEQAALMKLSMVGLPQESATLFPSQLSGGMKKRVGLARALIRDPQLLFLDEPTSGLDPKSARAFDSLICSLRDAMGITVVMVTHDKDTIASALDRFVILRNKKVQFDGDIHQLERSEDTNLREFLNK